MIVATLRRGTDPPLPFQRPRIPAVGLRWKLRQPADAPPPVEEASHEVRHFLEEVSDSIRDFIVVAVLGSSPGTGTTCT